MPLPASGQAKSEFLPLAVEDVSISRRRIAGDLVRLSIKTQTQEHLVDEELTHEQVIVEHVAVGRTVDSVPEIRVEGDVTIVPVVTEEIVVQRRLVLTEEIHMRRVRVTGRHRETVSLREQVAAVTRIGAGAPAVTDAGIPDVHPHRTIHPGAVSMTDETIVAVYDTAAHAEAAVAGLKAAGVPETAISMHAGSETMTGTNDTAAAPVREQGFWSSLFGGEPDHDTAVYDRSMASGSTVVSVKSPETHIKKVTEILESHHPIDIDERATGYGLTQTTTTRQPLAAPMPAATPKTGTDNGNLQLSEERLAVGKRVVNRGGTRIRRFVVETPVEQQVTLHDEKVTLERRPVTDGRPVTDSFSEKTVEMTESAEEAVVSKNARVYEEVGLNKEVTDRVETVRDTVRKEEVEIEQVPGGTATTTTTGNTPLKPPAPKI